MRLRATTLASALALVTPSSGAFVRTAHGQALVPDRPDFTEGTTTVGRGVLQFEFGYTFGFDDEDGTITRAHSFGEPLIRAGVLTDRLELRVGAGAASRTMESPRGTATESGLEDLYLGAKLALTGQRGAFPATAILPGVTLATGGEAFSAGRSLPGVSFVYGWDFTETLSLSGGTQVNAAAGEADEDHREWATSLSCGVALGARGGLYGEWYALLPSGLEDGLAEHYFNGGLSWLANDDLRWDIRVGVGLNDPAEDMYVGAGVAFRVR